MIRQRLHSPLRWLSAVMSALFIVALAGVFDATWLVAVAPIVAALFLLAPAVGIYRHDETPVIQTGVFLEAEPLTDVASAGPTLRFRLTLVNPGPVAAEDFRVRILIRYSLVPQNASTRSLGKVQVGEYGKNWFIESAPDATAITLRTAPRGAAEEISCPPNSRRELAELVLPAQAHPVDVTLDYQVSGGTVQAALSRLRLRSG